MYVIVLLDLWIKFLYNVVWNMNELKVNIWIIYVYENDIIMIKWMNK